MTDTSQYQSICSGRHHDFDAQVGSSLRRFMSTEAGSAGLLVVSALVALLWANSSWSGSYEALWDARFVVSLGDGEIDMTLHEWVNDALMVVFFFVIGLEVRQELAIGELTDRSRVVIPVVAGVGGMVVPAALYLLLNPSGEAANGWGVAYLKRFYFSQEDVLLAVVQPDAVAPGDAISPRERDYEVNRAESFLRAFPRVRDRIRETVMRFTLAGKKVAMLGAGHLSGAFINLYGLENHVYLVVAFRGEGAMIISPRGRIIR